MKIPDSEEEKDRKRGGRGVGTRLPWVGLASWIVLLLVIDIASRSLGLKRQVVYLVVAALATLAVVTLIGFARMTESPPELRTLRILTVLLPSTFILLIEVILYFLEVEDKVTEVGEHVVATAILSAGAVPFSVYVFRNFSRLRDELTHRAQHLETLHETSMSVTGELAPERLHEAIAQGAAGMIGADRAMLRLLPEEGRPETAVVAPQGETPTEREQGLALSVAASGEARRVSEGDRAFLGVALRRRGRGAGAITVARDAGRAFTVEDELVLDMFAVAASAGIENAYRLEEAQQVATIEERERIARELHDDLGQLLGFLTAKIQAAQELSVRGRDEQLREELAGLENATRMLGGQVREAILGLRARVGPDRSLGRALEDYVADFGIQAGLRAEFEGDPDTGHDLSGPSQYQLLRIAQEALSNARRHAGARVVRVGLRAGGGAIVLRVEDDGSGFDRAAGTPGFGLKMMAERAAALGGKFEVLSTPGSGTVVEVRVPSREA